MESEPPGYGSASSKLSTLSTRNVNKRIKRCDLRIASLEKENSVLQELKDELKDVKALLSETSRVCSKLESDISKNRSERKSLVKKVWYRDRKIERMQASTHTEDDKEFYKNHATVPEMQVKELEDCVTLCEDRTVVTFEDGKFTNTTRELKMELLSMNFSMSVVNKVIRSTLRKLANLEVGRLTSTGMASKLMTEAWILADMEVGLATREARLEAALGNVIRGDGTTKYHKKYQNFQVTLSDTTSRTTGLMQMGKRRHGWIC